ncbi:hypothetical protein PINS_up003673 [Pythium insidiosum]|nr:hypothetical protein PINS_up003673 [Pythium insidiosum]
MPQQQQQLPSALLSHPQIVRDAAPAVDPSEPRTRRSWEWVCAALVQKEGLSTDSAVAINLLDAVFVQKDQIWSWFYSSSGGIIRKKSQRKLQPAHVLQRFHQIAADAGDVAGGSTPTAVCWFDEQQRLQLLSSADLSTFLHACKGQACLSPFVAPRGGLDPSRFANLDHEFVCVSPSAIVFASESFDTLMWTLLYVSASQAPQKWPRADQTVPRRARRSAHLEHGHQAQRVCQ